MNILSESKRQAQRDRRQIADETADELAMMMQRLAEHDRHAATMRPAAPKKSLYEMTNREFLAELDRRHPWLPAARRELRRGRRS